MRAVVNLIARTQEDEKNKGKMFSPDSRY